MTLVMWKFHIKFFWGHWRLHLRNMFKMSNSKPKLAKIEKLYTEVYLYIKNSLKVNPNAGGRSFLRPRQIHCRFFRYYSQFYFSLFSETRVFENHFLALKRRICSQPPIFNCSVNFKVNLWKVNHLGHLRSEKFHLKDPQTNDFKI